MVRAWRIDESVLNPKEPRHTNPPQFVDADYLTTLGVKVWELDADNLNDGEGVLDKIIKERGYVYRDQCEVSKEHSTNYEEEWQLYYNEHMHADEEVRLIQGGSGYFDVRDKKDEWLRIEVNKGDLISIPAGLYHRFTTNKEDCIRAMRLFPGAEPVWTVINRPADDHPKRMEYIKQMQSN